MTDKIEELRRLVEADFRGHATGGDFDAERWATEAVMEVALELIEVAEAARELLPVAELDRRTAQADRLREKLRKLEEL